MHLPPLRRRLAGLFAIAVLLIAPACSHYQLGTGSNLDFESLFVPPMTNSAAVPQAVAPVTRALRTAFLRDGRVQLARSPAGAETVLTIELVDYDRENTAVQPTDTALARKFDITLTARATLLDQRTGTARFTHREFTVTRQIFVDDGQLPAEYQVLPQLAAELADRISHAVLDVW